MLLHREVEIGVSQWGELRDDIWIGARGGVVGGSFTECVERGGFVPTTSSDIESPGDATGRAADVEIVGSEDGDGTLGSGGGQAQSREQDREDGGKLHDDGDGDIMDYIRKGQKYSAIER